MALLPAAADRAASQERASRAAFPAAVDTSAVPIPPSEGGLPTAEAELFLKVSDEPLILEGPAFERDGSLLFVDAASGRVFRLTRARELSVVVPASPLGASGIAVHRDGRIYVAAVGDMTNGSVRSYAPDGSDMRMIVPPDAAFLPNDLVFDRHGGFYFTDSRGDGARAEHPAPDQARGCRHADTVRHHSRLPRPGPGRGFAACRH